MHNDFDSIFGGASTAVLPHPDLKSRFVNESGLARCKFWGNQKYDFWLDNRFLLGHQLLKSNYFQPQTMMKTSDQRTAFIT